MQPLSMTTGMAGSRLVISGVDCARLLRLHGLRVTGPRMSIVGVLMSSENRHWTVDDIYTEVRKSGKRLGFTSTYRVMNELEQAGVVMRRTFQNGKMSYELNDRRPNVHHLICSECGHVGEFTAPDLDVYLKNAVPTRGMASVDLRLNLYGLCLKCKLENADEE